MSRVIAETIQDCSESFCIHIVKVQREKHLETR